MAYYTDERRYFDDLYIHGARRKILFEGDSWFSIPDIANIPIQFDSLLDLSILCLADPGDSLQALSSGTQFRTLERLIRDRRYAQKWDALVFSAGGNDVIGPDIRKLLRASANPASTSPRSWLDAAAVANTYESIRQRFTVLKNLRDKSGLNATTPIFVHTYSYLTPRNIPHRVTGMPVSGPWIHPYMAELGISDCKLQQGIVKALLNGFWRTLRSIAGEPGSNFFVVDTRRALDPVACEERDTSFEYWRDEIHPTSRGFALITRDFFIPAMRRRKAI